MAIHAAKFMLGPKFELSSPRIRPLYWLKKSFVRNCSKERDFSSLPVRYIPNNPSKADKGKTSSKPIRGSDKAEMPRYSDSNASRVASPVLTRNVNSGYILNDKSQSGCQYEMLGNDLMASDKSEMSAVDAELDHKLQIEELEFMEDPGEASEELETSKAEDLIRRKSKQDVENMAVKLLATRAFTAVELKKKLVGKKFPLDIINSVLADFQSRGLINDFFYAETFSRSRWSSRSWGPRKLKQSLTEKGVCKSDAEKAIKLVLEEGESGEEEVSRLGLSSSSMNHLVTQASKQWTRCRDLPIEKQKSRVINWLQYRGFNWGVINFVLKKLQAKHPS